jgi:hypothetical protein
MGYGTFIAMAFGSLLFLVAGLYLPNVTKLKVGGLELEKGALDKVSPTIGFSIPRSSK